MKALVTVLGAVLLPSLALADESFEAKAQGAIKVAHTDDLVWAITAACDKGDDVQQRQCKVTRDKKAKQLTGAALIVEGDGDALQIGKFNPQKKSVSVTLFACVRCGGVDIEGKPWFVTGSGAPKLDGNRLRATTLYDNARGFANQDAATAWTKAMANARFQLVIKVPEANRRKLSVGGREGLGVDVLAWRVINPCDGTIVLSSVASQPVEPDKLACTQGGGIVIPPDGAEALTPAMVSDAMKPVIAAARACASKYKIPGKTKLEITILADGTVEQFTQQGDFEGTPVAKCIDEAMKQAAFPKTKKPRTKIGFPIAFE